MYEQLFQLRSRPFRCFPVVGDYYPARSTHQALGQIKLCLDRNSGTSVVIGEAGLGKTLVLTMVGEYQRPRYQSANIQCSQLTDRTELLQSILFELGQPYRQMAEGEMRLALMDYIRNGCRQERGVLLLVDDAQRLSVELLAELGAMSNLVWQGTPRCQLVLAGNHHLDELLSSPELESCNQRVAARCYLSPLTAPETADYVRTHLKRAGAGTREFFSPEALGRVHQLSQGIPRLINMLCDHALILLATLGGSRIDKPLIENAWSDVQRLPGAVELFQSSSAPESPEPWTVVEFGDLSSASHSDPTTTRTPAGYSWQPLDDELSDEAVEAELLRLQQEQEELIRLVEAQANSQNDDQPSDLSAEELPPEPKRIVDPFADSEFDFEEQVVSPALRFTWKHNQSASALHPHDLSTDFPWPHCEFDLTDSILIAESATQVNSLTGDPAVAGREAEGPSDGSALTSLTFPLESPISGSTPHQPTETPVQHHDDSDLLVVSRVNQFPSAQPDESEPASEPLPSTPSGRAMRMEYELLFDRLRGIVNDPPASHNA